MFVSGSAWAQVPGDPLVPADEQATQTSPVADPPTTADAATTSDSSLEEIVVTAERRTTSLQSVPIAVTALTADALSQAKVDTSSQLAQVTPSLVVAGVYENVLKVTLRGVGSNDFTQNMNPAVATYIDQVYMGLATGQALQFFDLDRVEVLRGPQGTLYGKNATGGAISYYSKRPNPKRFEGGINATYGNYDRTEVDGFVNVPLNEHVALRFSGGWKDRDGFFNNTFLGIKQRFAESKAARLQLLMEPNDDISMNFKWFVSDFEGDTPKRYPLGILDPANLGRFLIPGGVNIHGSRGSGKPYQGETEVRSFDNSNNKGFSANLAFDTGGPTITSISAWETNHRQAKDDTDGTRIKQVENTYTNDSEYVSQELRFSGDIGALDYVIGGHFYREEIEANLQGKLFECTLELPRCPFLVTGIPGYPAGPTFGGGPLKGVPIATLINPEYVQKNRSLAAFGDLKYHLGALTLTGGLRYTTEKRTFVGSATDPLLIDLVTPSPLFAGYSTFKGKKTWDNLSGRAVIDYKFGHSLVYASYSRGFRAGNWNGLGLTFVTVREPVDPEILTSYEVGLKSELLDRRVRLNLSAYYYDYSDLQVSIFVNTANLLQNAATAEIYGGEAELTALITEGLTLRASGSYTNATYSKFDDGMGNDLSGNRLVNTPKWTAIGGFTYEVPINDSVRFNASTDVRYQSKVYFNPYNFEDLTQKGYALVNARIGLDFNEQYSLALWGRNIFDKVYATDGQAQRAPFGLDTIIFGEPRMYGVTASAKF